MGKWLGKTPDASREDLKELAEGWRTVAAETEVNALGKSQKEIDEAASRAKGQRRVADEIDPDIP